jgi:myo-inositol-1(or 4)-monophosphatase
MLIINKHESLCISNKGPHDLVTQVDLEISSFLSSGLHSIVPGSTIISEEDKEEKIPGGEYTWIIDPIDGTTNFVCGMPIYAVSIGLLHDSVPVLGVVYNPARKEMFSALRNEGAWLGEKRIHVNADPVLSKSLVLAETDPYLDRQINQCYKLINSIFQKCLDYRIIGSTALDICYIASGRAGAFITPAAKPWDYAGGSLILLEAGGKITQWDNASIRYSGQHGLVASNGLFHKEILTHIRDYITEIMIGKEH